MPDDIRQWLEALGLGEYAEAFAKNKIDANVLPDLTNDDLKDIGVVAVGDRRKILAAISNLGIEAGAVAPMPAKPLDASRRQVTVLFTDLSGFTRLSSSLDAEETHALLNRFFATADEVVREFGGTIDKHIGDAVMAVFGAPVAHTDDPERALKAALGIHDAVAALDPPLAVHIGVASGQVVASSTGSAVHREYTVTGDSVNLAARLTDLARPSETLVSASVQRALGERFVGETLGEQLVDGLPEPVNVWRLRDISSTRSKDVSNFVGRHRELHQFAAAIDHCLERNAGETIVVRGEAGIGKSRLLEEFQHIATKRGFLSHTGLVLDFGTAKGQDAVRALVRSLLGITLDSGKEVRMRRAEEAIGDAMLHDDRRVYLNDLLDLSQPPDLRALYDAMDNKTRNRGKQETVAELVRVVSRKTPLLLKLEDLHWAAPVVLDHGTHMARIVAECRAVLVLTTRIAGDPLDQAWRAGTNGSAITTIDLGALKEEEANDLAHGFTGLDEELVRNCIARAGGNPLFLEQLLRNADELSVSDIPGTVQGIVQARLDVLPAADREALQAASVLGQRFSRPAMAALLNDNDYDPINLVTNALIRPAGDDYHFAHALIRDGVYASLLKPRRIELHSRAAAWFRETDLPLHAEHLEKADDPAAANAYLAAALEQSAQLRFETAMMLAKKGAALARDDSTRFELMCLLGDLYRDLDQGADSLAAYEKALVDAAGDDQSARANLGVAESLRLVDRFDDGFVVLDRAQAAAERAGSASHLARVHFVRGNLFFPLGRLDECRKEHEAALEHARRANSVEAEARALGGLADAAYLQRRMKTAVQNFERCAELARGEGLTGILAANIGMLATARGYNLEFEGVYRDGEEALDLAGRLGRVRAEVVTLAGLSYWRIETGDLPKALQYAQSMLRLVRQYNLHRFESTPLRSLALVHHLRGEQEKAMDLAGEAWAAARRAVERFTGPWALGVLALVTDNPERRSWALAEGSRILAEGSVGHNYLWFHRFGIEVGIETGNPALIAHHADALEACSRDEPLPWSDFYIARGRALAAFGRGDGDTETIATLRQLMHLAANTGLKLPIAQIENALASAKGGSE